MVTKTMIASQMFDLRTTYSNLPHQENSSPKCCATSNAAQKARLKVHPAKTKILSNQSSNSRKSMVIDNIKVEILTRDESTKYLGQMITFLHQGTPEIKYRIRAAWATFYTYKQELTSRSYPLRHRLRLFDAAITQTMNNASGTWALTKDHEPKRHSDEKKRQKKDPKQGRRKSD